MKFIFSFNIEKFRSYEKETSFNSVIELLANDIIDSYADNNETKAIFPNAITRFFKTDLDSRFNIQDSSMSEQEQK